MSLKKKSFHLFFHVISTNALPVTVLLAYTSLPRHIREDMLQDGLYCVIDLCTEVGCQQFRKEPRKRQRRIVLELNYSFYYHCLLSCLYAMFQKQYFQ